MPCYFGIILGYGLEHEWVDELSRIMDEILGCMDHHQVVPVGRKR